jgi:nucleotide-binding universal stress UspA family protein
LSNKIDSLVLLKGERQRSNSKRIKKLTAVSDGPPFDRQQSGLAIHMIRRILFPVDFSPSCEAMAPYVKRATELFQEDLSLIHIYDPASYNGFELVVQSPNEIAVEHLAVATERLQAFLESHFPSTPCQRIVVSGESAEMISQAVAEQGFDLIVIPTHAGRFRRMLLGSTAAKILDDVACPALTSQHSETNAPRPLEHRVWACAIGLTEDSGRVLRLAASAAAVVGARLCVIHAAPDGESAEAYRRLENLVAVIGCAAEIEIVSGPVKDVLLNATARCTADALIVGRALRQGVIGRLRDLTYSLIRDSPLPVLSV